MRLIKRGKYYHVRIWSTSRDSWVFKSTRESNRKRAAAIGHEIASKIKQAEPVSTTGYTITSLGALDIQRAKNEGAAIETINGYKRQWAIITKTIGDIRITSITEQTLNTYIAKRRAAGTRGQTIRRTLETLKRGMTIAKRRGYIHLMPHWPRIKRDVPDRAKAGKLHTLAHVERLLVELPEHIADELRFTLFTGVRHGELKRCRYDQVQFSTPPVLHLSEDVTKTRKARDIGLTDTTMNIIKRRLRANPDSPNIFSQADHKKAIIAACKRLGIERITYRDLRHMYGTYGLAATGDMTALVRAMGNSIQVADRYQSSTIERAHAIAQGVENAINRSSPTEAKNDDDVQVIDFMVGAQGLEPGARGLRIHCNSAIEHIKHCRYCQTIISDLLRFASVSGDFDHKPKQRTEAKCKHHF